MPSTTSSSEGPKTAVLRGLEADLRALCKTYAVFLRDGKTEPYMDAYRAFFMQYGSSTEKYHRAFQKDILNLFTLIYRGRLVTDLDDEILAIANRWR